MIELSEETIEILTNYSKINNQIYVRKGNSLSTIIRNKTLFVQAVVEEQFDQDFAINDLSELLSIFSVIKSPVLDLHEDHMVISSKENTSMKIFYYYTDKSKVEYSEKERLECPEHQVETKLSASLISKIVKYAGISRVEDIFVESENKKVVLKVLDVDSQNTNAFSVELGEMTEDQIESNVYFKYHFKLDNFKMIEGNYSVKFLYNEKNGSGSGMVYFANDDRNIQYFVALVAKTSQYSQ